MWQVVSCGTAERMAGAVRTRAPQDNQIQKGGPEDTHPGETLMQKSLPCSLGKVKESRDEEN